MSVIVTNKDIPSSCTMCNYSIYEDFFTHGHCDKLDDDFLINDYRFCRLNNCPLKSVEGLIEAVKNMCDDADVFTLTTEFMNNRISMEDFIDAIGEFYRKEVAEIIKGYCEVSK